MNPRRPYLAFTCPDCGYTGPTPTHHCPSRYSRWFAVVILLIVFAFIAAASLP